jgi:very-short-patch-repair endonuclease
VLRFNNKEVTNNLTGVLEKIIEVLKATSPNLS